MNEVLLDMEMARNEANERVRSARALAEKERLLHEIGYSMRAELVRLTVVIIALGLVGALVWVVL